MYRSVLSFPATRNPLRPAADRPFVAAWLAASLMILSCSGTAAAQSFDPSRARLVDLTHPFNINTVYWLTTPSGFGYAPISNGRTEGGWFYSAGAFQATMCSTRPSTVANAATMSTFATSMANTRRPPSSSSAMLWG